MGGTKREIEEEPPKLRRTASQMGLVATKSTDRLDLLLTNSSRKTARDSDNMAKEHMQDFSVIGVYSRESSARYARDWEPQKRPDTSLHATKLSKAKVSDKDAQKKLLDRQSRTPVSSDFGEQVDTLFKNKMIPHVLVVIEGEKAAPDFTLRTSVATRAIDLHYTQTDFIQGMTKKGVIDHKQSMTVYVRDDMREAYTITNEEIPHSIGKKIKAIGINYQTEDGTKYRSLVVHIPHEFLKSPYSEKVTNDAFEQYAKNELLSNKVVVTSYLGDTNFHQPVYDNSVPSLGGHAPDGNTLNPQSSTAADDTNFMQHVPLGESKPDQKHNVLQASALNYIFPGFEKKQISTDHVSINGYTAHASKIVGRNPKANSSYYENEME